MRELAFALAFMSLAAGCTPAPSASDQSAESAAAPAVSEASTPAGDATAPSGAVTSQEAANCMAYTTRQRQAVLAGQAQGDAMALLQATAAWRNAVAEQPDAQQFYQAAMSSLATMDQAALKAAADDCVARAPH